ncbi:MAG: tRNA (guanosine(37)-N1)-methyltransferase TrmD [Chitinivibrionales bacterium]|nr:tRNA (guanosine(37)-N1)-methyltransferase TrmD [Chitinivibrionales bacterium]
MIFEILTLFPRMFDGVFSDSIIDRAVRRNLVSIAVNDIRAYSDDARHRSVDDYPYGGGAGMVLKPQPVADAIRAAKARHPAQNASVVLLSPHGRQLDHGIVQELLDQELLILVCGRYKGVDQRVRDSLVDREISIGDYVLSGGEIPAMVLLDAVTRLIPGVLGDRESAESDSFYDGLLGPPQYTRPEVFEGAKVPEVLLSGHHEKIRQWQREQAESLTRRLRPDVWQQYCERRQRGEGSK